MSLPPSSRLRVVALVAVLASLAAACGGDDAAETTAAAATDAPATTAAALPTTTGGAGEIDGAVAAAGDQVSVHYVGTLTDGTEFDASRPRGSTLDFTVGAGQMIPGFDAAVVGMAVGETKTVTLPPAEAYGEVDPAGLIEVPLADLPEGVEVGTQLTSQTGQVVEVMEINGDTAIVDFNHRLAGETLVFEIEMVSITKG